MLLLAVDHRVTSCCRRLTDGHELKFFFIQHDRRGDVQRASRLVSLPDDQLAHAGGSFLKWHIKAEPALHERSRSPGETGRGLNTG